MTQLYTITFVTSVEVKTENGPRMRDTIQTFYDTTEKQFDFYAAKCPGIDMTVEQQTKKLGKAPKVDFGERFVVEKTPIKWWEEDAKRNAQRQPLPAREKPNLAMPPITGGYEKVSEGDGYSSLVNKMLEEGRAA